ncbi:MAG: hypothetical protein MJ025_06985, partial [Victivallaceae bacterium]|nr:hypothetical protein [Victivallaceae bacterium]
AYSGMSSPSAFAAVTVAVPAKVSVAVQDYSLSYGGGDYPCVAARRGDGAWDCSLDARKPSSDGERWTFLFALNGTLFTGSDDMKMDLRSNFTGEKLELKFRNLKGGEFSSTKKAPDSGAL